jgi:hypothetical protein
VSRYDYEVSQQIALHDFPFAALIMAAMRQADTQNMAALRAAFPGVAAELEARYHAPGGLLPGEAGPQARQEASTDEMCPGGCGCRLGTDDADRFECGCDEGCCGEEASP